MAGNPITKIIITAKDEASAVFSSLQAKVAGIAAAIAGYFGAKMFGEALGSAMDFEAAMSRVQAASGASGADLAKLKAAAEDAGATTKYTSTQAAEALETLAKSGLNASQAVQALPAVLNLAQAGGVELGTAAEFVTKAVNGMGLSFAEAGRVADVLALGANASNTSVEGLAGALSYAAPLANSLGLSLEQTVAIIGKFADAGIDASRAGTALNSILAQFSDPASKFRDELANAGIITNNFGEALRQLAAKGPQGSKAIAAVGQEAGPALRALLNQGIGALDDLTAKLQHAKGSAAETAATMGGNLTGAMAGLSSAWDAVRRNLVAPLLDPLAEQVNALSARFREAVTDGTIGRFGEAIRIAFESAAKWVQEFVGKVNFTEVATRLQEFASKTGEVFAAIGQHAANASGVVQTAYGVMKAGASTVMAVIYKIAEAFAGVVSNILSGVALLNDGMAKITFGGVSERYRAVANEIREVSGGLEAVSQEFAAKSSAAFDAAAAGAETAANGWNKLTATAQEAAPAVTQTAQAVQQVGEQAGLTADQLDALGKGAEFVGGEVKKAGEAAATAAPKLKAMGEDAAAAAAQVDAAFARLGVTSQAALKQAAANAKRDFEIIRNSGDATARDIQNAFTAYATKAIAANNGVADAVLKAQAAQVGLKVEADSTGKAVVRSMTEAAAKTAELGDKADESAGKFAAIGDSAEQSGTTVSESMRNAAESTSQVGAAAESAASSFWSMSEAAKAAESETARLKRWESEGAAARQTREVGSLDPFMEAMKRRIVTDPALESEFRNAFTGFFNQNLSQIRAVSSDDYIKRVNRSFDDAIVKAAAAAEKQKAADDKSGVRTNRFEVRLHLGSISRTVNVASANDAQNLTDFLQQLENEARRAS